MTRAVVSWIFMSTVMFCCEPPEPTTDLRRDPQQLARISPHRAGQGTAPPQISSAASRLRNTIALVCDGVPETMQTTCPIASDAVSRVVDSDEGVIVLLRGYGPDAQLLTRHVQCYRALASVREAAPSQGCALDVADADVSVRTIQRDLAIEVVGRDESDVMALRSAVRERLVPPRRRVDRRASAYIEGVP